MLKTTDLILEPLNAGPSTHYERIIGSDNSDDIDALGFEFIVLLEVRG